jgi:DNA-binding NarL/FixJ family response regulator
MSHVANPNLPSPKKDSRIHSIRSSVHLQYMRLHNRDDSGGMKQVRLAERTDSEAALNAISDLRRHFPEAELLVLVGVCITSLLSKFICAGVNAVPLTEISGEMLLGTLELVLFGGCIFPEEVQAVLTDNILNEVASEQGPTESLIKVVATTVLDHDRQGQATLANVCETDALPMVSLSDRERQIMSCLARGWSNKSISRELNIADATVKVYLKCLSRKIRLNNRTQLAGLAVTGNQ